MEKGDFEDLKSTIRSIIFTSGMKCDFKDLTKGFWENEGKNLHDYLRNHFGMTVNQFISKIPDVCKINKSNGLCMIEMVSSSDSEHLNKLKANEKNSRSCNRRFTFNNYNYPVNPFPNYLSNYQLFNSSYQKSNQSTLPITRPFNINQDAYLPPQSASQPQSNINFHRSLILRNSDKNSDDIVSHREHENFSGGVKSSSLTEDASKISQERSKDDDKSNHLSIVKQTVENEKKFGLEKNNSVYIWTSADEKSEVNINTIDTNETFSYCSLNTLGKAKLEDYIQEKLKIPDTRLKLFEKVLKLKVKIVEVSSPTDFIFQSNLTSFDNLVNEMTYHYNKVSKEEKLKISKIFPGMTVAAYYKEYDKWYRAEVKCVGRNEIFVYFIDLGIRKLCDITDLRYLRKSFAAISRLARRGSLYNVKPKLGKTLWDKDASEKFMSYTKKIPLYAKFFGEDSMRSIEMILFFGSITLDTNVADILIHEHFCEPKF